MRKLSELKPFDRVKVQYKGIGGKTHNTGYVDFDYLSKNHASFSCDNGLDKYIIKIENIIRII